MLSAVSPKTEFNLVSILCRRGSFSLLPASIPGFEGRLIVGLWHRGGKSPILVASIYGYSQPDAAQLSALNQALVLCQELAEQRGSIPAIIGGDLNTLLESVPAAAWFSAGGWVDLNAASATCASVQGSARRIDCLLINRNMSPLLLSHELDWFSGLSTHAAQSMDFHAGTPPMHTIYKRPPKHQWSSASAAEVNELDMQVQRRLKESCYLKQPKLLPA